MNLSSYQSPVSHEGLPSNFAVEASSLLEIVEINIERDPEKARIVAIQLVKLLTPHHLPVTRGGLASWQKNKILRYFEEHIEKPIQLQELAARIPLSLSHFCRAFKESLGTTPHMYLIQLRLARAQWLMLNTAYPLCQISLMCGFSDQAHLSKLFRRVLGQTPSLWRRRNATETLAAK